MGVLHAAAYKSFMLGFHLGSSGLIYHRTYRDLFISFQKNLSLCVNR